MVIDVFKLVWLMLAPNEERGTWIAIQKAWLAFARERLIHIDDDRDDTWPVMTRRLGTLNGIGLLLDGYTLEAGDPAPLTLVCEVASGRLQTAFEMQARIETGDATFDAELEVRTDDEAGARTFLHEDLRKAIGAFAPPVFFRYSNGKVKFSSGSTTLETNHLAAVLAVVLAACRRPKASAGPGPYR